jgi:hypothetical protein
MLALFLDPSECPWGQLGYYQCDHEQDATPENVLGSREADGGND